MVIKNFIHFVKLYCVINKEVYIMSVYMISFDLKNKPDANYKKMEDAIRKLGSCTKILNTTYIISLDGTTCEQIKETLEKQASLDATDKLCVAELYDIASTEPKPTEALILSFKKYLNDI